MHELKKARLILEDGAVYEGTSFGYEKSVSGEVVFYTAMTGYPESLTDPSYKGQILVPTYPMIGNYGVPVDDERDGISKFFESDKIYCKALVISDYSSRYSHWNSQKSLGDWLKEQQIPGLFGIDTRALAQKLRDHGAMLGKILFDDEDIPFYDPNKDNIVAEVSTKKIMEYGNGKYKVILVDCGVKNNILRCLLKRDVTVKRVPWNYDFTKEKFDGIFLSNGPGDPSRCGELKYGHRSHNQPVMNPGGTRCYITSQNHGFAIDETTLPADWEPLFVNVNDGTNEGIRHKKKPFFSAQFHPEASSGPVDTEFLFDNFITAMKSSKK